MKGRALVLGLAVVAVVAAAAPVPANTIVVSWAGGADYTAIKPAIFAAESGDTILVAPGTYTGEDNRDLDFYDMDLVLTSIGGARATIIDCGNTDRALRIFGQQTPACVVRGFTFTNGSSDLGGAVFCSDFSAPTFIDCVFWNNYASAFGGGVLCAVSSPATFTNCIFMENSCGHNGGGMYCQDSAAPTLTDCAFYGNSAVDEGGGVACWVSSSPSFTNCSFSNNASDSGAGIHCEDLCSPTLTNCTFWGNSAVVWGGGLYCESDSSPALTNCTFYGNSAGGYGGGAGAGIFTADESRPVVTNSIIAFSTEGEAVFAYDGYGDAPHLSCCDIFGNAGGDWTESIWNQEGVDGNMSADPLFCDAPAGDFTIDAASPCAPVHSAGCGLIGAWDVGCDSPVENASWGAIKGLFR